MIHDNSAEQIEAIFATLAAAPDKDELPAGGDWAGWAERCPESVAWTLDALGKKKLSAVFRAKYRELAPRRNLTGGGELAERCKIDAARLPPLPLGSFLLEARIGLEQPMMTRDDRLFTVSDNTVRKDRAMQWPYLAASSWKGAFRGALYRMGHNSKKIRHAEYDRIWGVGPEEGHPESGQAGRLHFYPTFFRRVDYRVLNRQSRLHRSGGIPVELEVVPNDDSGWFQMLYVPYFLHTPEAWRDQLGEDWKIISQVTATMLRTTGFGAKVSSGFGVAKDVVERGLVHVRRENGWQRLPFARISDLPAIDVADGPQR